MNVQKRNDVTIYCLSSGPTLPEWLGERARRNLSKRDEQIRRRIELIQDFQMPSSSSKVVQSADGRYIIAAGTYPPRIRCYDVHDLTMKFERYVNSEIIDLIMLGEDYGKMAMLLDDRTIAFHAHYGSHETIRIPKFGRGMAYEPTTCELLVAANGNNVFRLNLEEGRHSEPWTFEPSSASASCISVSNAQPLAAVGCDDGIVRFWDNRTPDSLLKPFLKMDVQSATAGYGFGEEGGLYSRNPHEITSIAHDTSGLYMAAGTAGGIVALYDVRSSRPLHLKEHKLGMPIHTIKFHSGSGSILSSDEKLVKIWRYKSNGDLVNRSDGFGDMESGDSNKNLGSIVANIEGTGKFTNFLMAGDENDPLGSKSGLLLCATDQPKLESYYIPKVGLAPKWCSFLESITEELEERDLNRDGSGGTSDFVRDGQEAVFENYKFVSREDVEKLGISDLVGTPLLRGYMHGFFMDINLYNRVRAVANPFEYEEYRKKKLKEKINAKRASRIAPKEKRTKAAVNPELADRLLGKADDSTKAGKFANKMLKDDRFGSLFSNPDYQINENDDDFKLRNPSGVANAKKKRKDDMDSDDEDNDVDDDEDDANVAADEPDEAVGFRPVQQSDNEASDDDHSDNGDSDSDEDGFRGGKVRGEAYDEVKALDKKKNKKPQQQPNKRKKSNKAVMYEADDIGGANAVELGLGGKDAPTRVKKQIKTINMPLEKRFKLEEETKDVVQIKHKGGAKEVEYIPMAERKKQEARKAREGGGGDGPRGGRRERRGIKELGFKTPFKNK